MNITGEYLVKRIVNNAIVNWITKFIIAMSAIIITPILISSLGKYEYGIWVLIGQIISFMLIADLGIANTVCRLISKYDAVHNEYLKISIYSTSMFIFLIVVTITIFVTLIVVSNLASIINLNSEYETVSQYVFLILAANIFIAFPLRVGRGLLQSKHRFDYIDIISTVAKIIQLLIISLMYYFDNITLISLALVIAIINTCAEVLIFLKAKSLNKDIVFKASTINIGSVKEIMSLGGASLLQTLSSAISRQGMILVVGIMLGVLYAPIFSIPLLLLISIGPLIARIGTTFMPIVSAYDSLNEPHKIIKLSVYGTRYTFMLGLLIAWYIFLYGKELLGMWLPSSEISLVDIDLIYSSLLIIIFPFILACSNQGNRVILLSTGNHWIVANVLLISSITGIILSIFLVKFTDLSLYSVVISWAVKLFVGDYLIIFYFLTKNFCIELLKYMKTAYWAPLLTILPIAILTFGFKLFFQEHSFIALILGSLFYAISSIFFVYFLCAKKKHIKLIIPKKYLDLGLNFRIF